MHSARFLFIACCVCVDVCSLLDVVRGVSAHLLLSGVALMRGRSWDGGLGILSGKT